MLVGCREKVGGDIGKRLEGYREKVQGEDIGKKGLEGYKEEVGGI